MARDAASACLESMPPGAKSVVRVAAAVPRDVEVVDDASQLGAAAAVIVSWHDASLLTSDVRVFVASPGDGVTHWITRTIVFSVRDLPAERGRALGLVIASVLDESWGIALTPSVEHPVATLPLPGETGKVEDEPSSLTTRPGPIESPETLPRWALEANVTTATGHWEDVDDSIGGMIALRRSFSTHWTTRAGLGFRVADIDGADATGRTVLGAAGVVWMSSRLDRPRTLAFGARADLLGMHEAIQRGDAAPSGSRTEGYWSVGADLLGQVGYGLSSSTALTMGGGVEGFLAEADIIVAGQPAATIPHTQLVLELGVLSRF